MKTSVFRQGLLGLLLLVLPAGCASVVFPLQQEKPAGGPTEEQRQSALTSEALAHYSMGILEGAEGQNEQATAHYEAAVRSDPDNVTLRLELAVVYFHQDRLPDMFAMLDEVLRRDPKNLRALQLKVLGLRLQGKHLEALEPLKMAVTIEPAESSHYLEIASIYARQKNMEEALSVLEKALPKVQDRIDIFQALGELYLTQAVGIRQNKQNAVLPLSPLDMMASALEEFPEDPYLLTQYGDLLIVHRKIKEAIDVFARIEALNPDDLMIRQKLALNLAAVGDRGKAIEMLEDLSTRPPENPRVLFYLAELYEQDEQTEKALGTFARILKRNPKIPEAYIKQAFLYMSLSQIKEAQVVLEEGRKNVTNDIRIVEMLGYTHAAMTNQQEAITCFELVEAELNATDRKPLMSNFYLNFAMSHQQLDHIDEATRLIRTALEMNPESIDDYLAIVLRSPDRNEKLKRALEVLDQIEDSLPNSATTRTMYGLIAFQSDNYAVALEQFERAEQISLQEEADDELTAQFYFWLGASAERIKNYDKAETYFLRAIQLEPDHAESHNYLAYMLADRGEKLDMAIDHAGVALAIEPENAAYIDTRGWIYYQQGLYEKALDDILAAHALLPDDPTINDHLGDVYHALGKESEARTWWQKSIDLDPTNEKTKEKLNTSSPPTGNEADVE